MRKIHLPIFLLAMHLGTLFAAEAPEPTQEPAISEIKYEPKLHSIDKRLKSAKRLRSPAKPPLSAPVIGKVFIDQAKNDKEKDKLVGEMSYKPLNSAIQFKGIVEVDKEGGRSAGVGLTYSWGKN